MIDVRTTDEHYITLETLDGLNCTVRPGGEPEDYTPDERWEIEWPDNQHPYGAAAQFAMQGLGLGSKSENYYATKRRLLTVGSTVFEARMLRGHLWTVTMLDVRPVPVEDVVGRIGDATDIPYDDEHFDALSSTCCLCHVGLGRYGDAHVERGDKVAMREFARVLKPGSKASVMFGPALPVLKKTVTMGTTHRVYAMEEVGEMATAAGFRVKTAGMWCAKVRRWLATDEIAERRQQRCRPDDKLPYCYLTMLLEKR